MEAATPCPRHESSRSILFSASDFKSEHASGGKSSFLSVEATLFYLFVTSCFFPWNTKEAEGGGSVVPVGICVHRAFPQQNKRCSLKGGRRLFPPCLFSPPPSCGGIVTRYLKGKKSRRSRSSTGEIDRGFSYPLIPLGTCYLEERAL